MDLSGYSDDQLQAMLNQASPVGAPAAPATPTPDLSHLSDEQLRAMLPSGGAPAQQPLTIKADAPQPADGGDTAAAVGGGMISGVPVLGPGLQALTERGIVAPLRMLSHGESYGDALKAAQDFDRGTAANHPYATTAGGLVGGGLAMAPVVAAAPAYFGLGAGPLAGRVLAGFGSGSVLGGTDAAVRSEGSLGDRVLQTAIGVGTGGVLGGLAPAAGAAIGAGYRRLFGQAVQDTAEVPMSVRTEIVKKLRGDAAADPIGKLRTFGDQGMLADTGPGLEGVAMGQAAKVGGAGAPIILSNLAGRAAGTSNRVLGDVAASIGPQQNADAVARQIAEYGQASTAPYFARATAAGVPQGADLDGILARPAVASAVRDAATTAANRGTPFPTVTLNEAGQPVASDAALASVNARTRPAVTDAMARLLGTDPNMGPLAAEDALVAERKAAADPLYRAYRSMNVPMTPELADVMNRPSVRAALPAAERKAQDQGRTIFVQRGNGFDRDPLGSGAASEMPADLPDIPPYQAEQAPSRPGPVGVPRPTDLHDFVRSAGGIQDRGGDLASMGLDHLVAKPGQGLGADAMRQVAAQAGYLNHTVDGTANGATRFSTVNDLFDALGSDNPVHSAHDAEAVAAWAARDEAMDAFNRGGAARGDVGHDAGARPAAPGLPFGGPDEPPANAPGAPQLTPEGIDYLKRALQDKLDAAQSSGNRDDARIYKELKDQLLGAIDSHPDPAIAEAYGAARRAYAGPSREIDAQAAGRASFADTVTPEQVQREYAALTTDGERQRYRDGLFSAGRDKLAKSGDTRNFVDMVAGNDAIRSKFAAVAPHTEALSRFNTAMDQARQTFSEAQRPTASGLHDTLNTLDARVAKTGDAGTQAARDDLAARLNQNLDFARGRALQADYGNPAVPNSGELPQALHAGRTALQEGMTAVAPDDYATYFNVRSPAAQATQQAGLNSEIYRRLGSKANDLSVMGGVLKGPNDRSRSVIGTTFGQDAADALANIVDRERTFDTTHTNVAKQSITARRGDAIADQKAAEPNPYQISGVRSVTPTGLALEAARKPINALLRMLQPEADPTAHDIAISRVVSATGAERNRLLAQLLRAQAQETANERLQARGAGFFHKYGAPASPALTAALLRRSDAQPSR